MDAILISSGPDGKEKTEIIGSLSTLNLTMVEVGSTVIKREDINCIKLLLTGPTPEIIIYLSDGRIISILVREDAFDISQDSRVEQAVAETIVPFCGPHDRRLKTGTE